MVERCPMGLDGVGQPSGWHLDEDIVLPEAEVAIVSVANAGHLVAGVVGKAVIPVLGDISRTASFILSTEARFVPDEALRCCQLHLSRTWLSCPDAFGELCTQWRVLDTLLAAGEEASQRSEPAINTGGFFVKPKASSALKDTTLAIFC